VRRALEKDTILVSVMASNNETGCIMPIEEIGGIAKGAGVVMHTDAVQSTARSPVVGVAPRDLLTFSGHKVNGLKGAGAARPQGIELEAAVHGGHQERGRRGGTENVVGSSRWGRRSPSFRWTWPRKPPRSAGFGRVRTGAVRADPGDRPERAPHAPAAEHGELSFRYVEGERCC